MAFNNHHGRAVVFDFGGVLVDWNPLHLYRKLFDGNSQAAERFLDEIGFDAWNTEMDRRISLAEGIAELSRRFPQYAEMIRAYDARWEESIAGPIESNVQLLRTLKQAGYPVYGLSNCPAEKYWMMRSKFTFFDQLNDAVVSGEVNLLKPDPRIFNLLLERAGCAADACVFIDDSEENVMAAQQLGWDAIQYRSPEELQAELSQRGLMPSS